MLVRDEAVKVALPCYRVGAYRNNGLLQHHPKKFCYDGNLCAGNFSSHLGICVAVKLLKCD